MNGMQLNGKPRRLDRPVPGCLGRMVNLFDLASTKNRLLTDKPHIDGSSVSRSRSDVSRMSSIMIDEMQDEVIPEWSSLSKKPHGMPVKMLLAQEMSKEFESRQNSPNVVARLMGLDALPQQQHDLATRRIHSQCYSRNNHLESYSHEEQGFFPRQNDFEVHPHQGNVHDFLQQSHRKNCNRDKSPQKGSCNESASDKKLALIRQKFMEAKRLATDEKLRQTKEFHDALDVLSSNGDLFLKVLQEPNSFSSQLYGGQSITPPETKRITVLRPSKMMLDDKFVVPGRRNEKLVKKQVQVNLWDNHSGFSPTMSMWKANDSPSQPTRIVVLKPSPKLNGSKPAILSLPSTPQTLQRECFFEELEDEEAREAREMAKEITQQMRENLGGHRRDETLISSVFSNGYTGDDSSFENEFATGNLSDSEAISPISRHSWDYLHRYDSPYSLSSFSRASCSPESLVCREAKRRLSERWATLASSGCNQEQRQIRKSSSTLGEMLALSEIKKPEIHEEDNNVHQQPRGSTSCLSVDMGVGGSEDASPRNLLRSKSVPVSSTAYGDRLNVEFSNPDLCKEDASKEMKMKAPKSSFTGKVTGLFFSRNKKLKKEKSGNGKPQLIDESQFTITDTMDEAQVGSSPILQVYGGNIIGDPNDRRQKQGIHSQQGGLCVSESVMHRIQGENQEQPSPISVLDQPFEEDGSGLPGWSRSLHPSIHGKQMPLFLSKSNLIDKSPPIGSIARTLSWDESSTELATTYSLKSPRNEDDENEWRSLVQSLFTMAGLNDEGQLGKNVSLWHSSESPLDPLLRHKFIDLSSEEPLHEARRRHLRSTRKLVFDFVNAVLVDMTSVGTAARQRARPYNMFSKSVSAADLADEVWERVKEWVSGYAKCRFEDGEDGGGSLVEREAWIEGVGKGWRDGIRVEVDNIGKEIEGKLLHELVEESVVEWTVRG